MPAPLPTSIEVDGNAIRRRRMHLGLTMRQVATAAEVSESYVSMLEIGARKRVRPRALYALAKALDVEPQTLHARPLTAAVA